MARRTSSVMWSPRNVLSLALHSRVHECNVTPSKSVEGLQNY